MSFALLTFPSRNGHSQENVRIAHPSLSASVLCLIIANKEGYCREEGLTVEFLSIRGEIAIRTTLASEIDMFTNAGSGIAAVARNVPVKILAVFQDRPGWDLIALPNIKSIAQLRGQTVAIMSPEGSLAVVTREVLKNMASMRRRMATGCDGRRRCALSGAQGQGHSGDAVQHGGKSTRAER